MSKPQNLREILIEEIKDLYNAENQLIKTLPKMAKAATDPALANAFTEHLDETKEHARRLERAAEMLGTEPTGKTCKAMKGLIAEGGEKFRLPAGSVRDASLICAAQKVEHYEIAGYGTVRTFAQLLGDVELADLLQETLNEEANADKTLTQISERINEQAEVAA